MKQVEPKSAKEWLDRYGPPSMAALLLGIIIVDVHGSCQYANSKALELLQTSWRQLRRKGLHDVVCSVPWGSSSHTSDVCAFTRPLRTGRVRLRRIQLMYAASGQPLWIEYSTSPIREGRKIVACLVSFADASKMLRTKREFAETQALFRAVFVALSDSLFIVDNDAVILQANPSAVDAFGDIVFGQTLLYSLVSPSDEEKLKKQIKKRLTGRKRRTFFAEAKQSNGPKKNFQITIAPHFVQGRHVVKIRNITQQVNDQLKKERMMAIAGHELRTPIAVIKAFSQLVKRQLRSSVSEKYLGYLDRIERKASVLQQLLDNVLDEVRAGENKLVFSEEIVDMDELVTEVIQDMRLVSTQHIFKLSGKSGVKLKVDRGRITQVLTNVLTNAVKYSPNAKEIKVKLASEGEHVLISVKDYGLGIPESAQKHIFEAFFRSSHNRHAAFPGLGLGLYLSHKIVTHYHGTISFSSKSGKGTTFTISLPIVS
ncbi:PAS domain-containing sensor histidine kinase [Candidatus Woesebacteria bacterium]|nr:PAS domain-containing sensor histidine kinase [Candidatus Woesebacteria bacterium]